MPNDVYTTYNFTGNIPEKLKSLEYGTSAETLREVFELDIEDGRWYFQELLDVEDNAISFSVWSAWVPIFEPWQLLAVKYDLEMTYFTVNELPYYFDSNNENDVKYIVYYGYENPEEWYHGEYEYFKSGEDIRSFVEDIQEYKIFGRTDPEDWYYDEDLIPLTIDELINY